MSGSAVIPTGVLSLIPTIPQQLTTAPVAVFLTAAAVSSGTTWFVPFLISVVMQYRYDVTSPEGRVVDVGVPDPEYDFIVGEHQVV
jgi:hypothetical protein